MLAKSLNKEKTPEQEALLRGLNYREYPSIQERAINSLSYPNLLRARVTASGLSGSKLDDILKIAKNDCVISELTWIKKQFVNNSS